MSKNSDWCKPIAGWRKSMSNWVRKARPEDLLNVDIFFDFIAVYGVQPLADQLHQAMSGRATRQGTFLISATPPAMQWKNIFGGLKQKMDALQKLNVLL